MTGKQATDWAKALAIFGGLVLGGYSTWVKGEPGAALAYKELAKGFNELRTEFEKQRSYNEGFIAGFTQPLPPQPDAAPVQHPKCAAAPDAGQNYDAGPPPAAASPAPPRRDKPRALPEALPPQLEQLKREFSR